MADIDFNADDSEGIPDYGYGLDTGVADDDAFNPDDNLSPLQKLEVYMGSDIFNRQMVARGLLDTLRAVGQVEDDCRSVLKAMVRLSGDPEPSVRSELMEQVPHLAMYCQENRSIFQDALPVYILPMVVQYLNDSNNQVRKTSQAALLVLLEQDLVDKTDIEEQVISVILELASADSLDDFRTEAVALMSKMAPLLGKEMTERLFLPRFCEMCMDPLFHVRKVCAANFGDICTVAGQENTEQHLMAKFYFLCEDGVWGVRKACAECFMVVSCSCSQEMRKTELAGLFVKLLCDQSRWVRMTAFQQLGPFISTFADPGLTGLYVNDEGHLCVKYALDYIQSESADEKESIANIPLEHSTNCANVGGTDEKSDSPTEVESTHCDCPDESLMEIDEEPPAADADLYSDSTDKGCRSEMSVEELRAEKYSTRDEINECKMDQTTDNNNKQNDNDAETVDVSNSVINANQGSIESASDEVQGLLAEPANVEHIHLDSLNDFNSFHYWRTPFPTLDIGQLEVSTISEYECKVEDCIAASTTDEKESSKSNDVRSDDASNTSTIEGQLDKLQICDDEPMLRDTRGDSDDDDDNYEDDAAGKMHTASVSTVCETGETVANIGSTHVIGHQMNETTMSIGEGVVQDLSNNSSISYIDSDFSISHNSSLQESMTNADDANLALQQDIVPLSLLQNYLGMVDPSRAQTVDTEITRFCAYNLPAVAYTLGRENWPCIRQLYETLASDMQWKVRRTLALSIHELAIILGPEITHQDLVPVFNGFLRDLDEVRVGVLKHFANFLKLLKPHIRQSYLNIIQDFMTTDNHRNWRFRLELSEQMSLLCELYSAHEISQYLAPVSIALLADKVSDVRQSAFRLISIMMSHLSDSGDEKAVMSLVNEIIDKFAMNEKWYGRQIYAQLCQVLLQEDAISPDRFAKDFLPSLLNLGSDAIPNVRISLAKTLSQCVIPLDYFTSYINPHHEDLLAVLQLLQTDGDRDVRHFASQPQQTSLEHQETVPV